MGQLFGVAFRFTDGNPSATPSDFTGTITWGDSTSSTATVTKVAGTFYAEATHTYTSGGTFSIHVSVLDDGGATASGTGTVTVAAPTLVVTPIIPLSDDGLEGTRTGFTLVQFTAQNASQSASAFSASIDWGDGTAPTAGGISFVSGSTFEVSGDHAYVEEGVYTAAVTVTVVGTSVSAVAHPIVTVDDAPVVVETFNAAASTPLGSSTDVSFKFVDGDLTAPAGDYTVTIDWGDGRVTTPSFTQSFSIYFGSDSHIYATAGTYTIALTVHDVGGSSASQSAQTTVTSSPSLSASGTFLSGVEGALLSGTVATFTVPDINLTVGAFSASIDWGDGTSATAGTITGSISNFSVAGSHTYADEKAVPYAVAVTITQTAVPGNHATASSSASIVDAALHAGSLTLPATVSENVQIGVAFAFTDGNQVAPASDFTATIAWGDTTSSTATVTGSGGSFLAQRTHTYASAGPFTVQVSVHDLGGAGTSATGSVTVSAPTLLASAVPFITAVEEPGSGSRSRRSPRRTRASRPARSRPRSTGVTAVPLRRGRSSRCPARSSRSTGSTNTPRRACTRPR